MYRIAIAGFQHETNTFVTKPTTLVQFQVADSWPQMLQGSDVISGTQGMNLPVAGFIDACACSGIAYPLPILWCAAEPSGKVTADAFDTITGMIVDQIKALGEIDAVYLDLHGAMVTDTFDDGDLEIIRRVRQTIGPNISIGVSFDLHANISAEITGLVDVITIYKTYPHLDMADTGARNFDLLVAELNGAGSRLAFLPINYLIPLHAQNTAKNHSVTYVLHAIHSKQMAKLLKSHWASRPQIPHIRVRVSSSLHQARKRRPKRPARSAKFLNKTSASSTQRFSHLTTRLHFGQPILRHPCCAPMFRITLAVAHHRIRSDFCAPLCAAMSIALLLD